MGLQISSSRTSNLLALLAIVGILGAFLLAIGASINENRASGPSAITSTAAGEIYFVASERLFRLDREGKLISSTALAELGVDGQVYRLKSLENDLLMVQSGRDALLSCDTSLWRCASLFRTSALSASDVITLAPAEQQQQRIYLVTFSNQRLYAVDPEGRELYRLRVPGGLNNPNDIDWLGAERLLVADTDHHRIVEFEDLGDGQVRLIRILEAKPDRGRAGRIWPTEVVRDRQGGTWVIAGSDRQRRDELIYFDTQGRERRVELDAASDPRGLALVAGGVLISDRANHRLMLMNRDDFSVSRFGGEALQAALAEIATQQAYWHQIYYLGIAVAALFVALGTVAGYFDWQARQRLRNASADASQKVSDEESITIPETVRIRLKPDEQGIYWLGIDSRIMYALYLFVVVALILLWLLQAYSIAQLEGERHWSFATPLLSLTLITSVLVIGSSLTMRRIRLGSDGSKLYLIDLFGRSAAAPPRDCLNTGRRLLIGKLSVPIGNPQIRLYDKALFAELIEPMLMRVPKTNELAIYWRYLSAGDPLTWAGSLAFVVMAGLGLWLTINPAP